MIGRPLAQLDRVHGVLLGTAAGDALGAPYEFGPPQPDGTPIPMAGGEWTDDTAMSVAIAEVAASGIDLRSAAGQDRVVARWVEWACDAIDVGHQTRAVLARASSARAARDAARELHERTGRSGGNGSLMRTSPVALAYLDDEDALIAAATQLSALTHFDPEAGEACVLWCLAIRHAVLTGELDVRVGLAGLPPARAGEWARRIEAAEAARPADFSRNGWVVEALQAAWSAVVTTSGPDHLRAALEAAVRGGRDTDTVAAIAGALLGAGYGAASVPAEWRAVLHGWPGLRAAELVQLAATVAGT